MFILILTWALVVAAYAQHPEAEFVLRVKQSCVMCAPGGNYTIELYTDGFVNYEFTSQHGPEEHTYFVPKIRVDSLVNAFLTKGISSWKVNDAAGHADSSRHSVDVVSSGVLTELTFWHGATSDYIRSDQRLPSSLSELVSTLNALVDTHQWWPGGRNWRPQRRIDSTKH
ncbi:MAG TPA: hypothetical protein VEW28_05710 [Candidatus Kapabacteria bacterium]|nr:hypothetical protein [Candidatus Kapabacteria bacterium]